MRIDEFSNASNIDGSISITEQSQFLLFGFDISLDATASFLEILAFDSAITKQVSFDSKITKILSFDSPLED